MKILIQWDSDRWLSVGIISEVKYYGLDIEVESYYFAFKRKIKLAYYDRVLIVKN